MNIPRELQMHLTALRIIRKAERCEVLVGVLAALTDSPEDSERFLGVPWRAIEDGYERLADLRLNREHKIRQR